jgi:hypothetical protein
MFTLGFAIFCRTTVKSISPGSENPLRDFATLQGNAIQSSHPTPVGGDPLPAESYRPKIDFHEHPTRQDDTR